MKVKLFAFGTVLIYLSINLYSQSPAARESKIERGHEIHLEPVERGGGRPFMEVLNERQSTRQFTERELEPRILSGLLWAANGINRETEGKRTAPSARDAREIDVYLLTPHGIYFYIPEGHRMRLIKTGDYRKEALVRSEFALQAPIVLVYVANGKKLEKFDAAGREIYSAIDCGFVSQNVYLYCASENLATVVLGGINKEALGKILGLTNDKVLLAQPVGYKD
jgi:SagB-type dehydrogenase family enzyme